MASAPKKAIAFTIFYYIDNSLIFALTFWFNGFNSEATGRRKPPCQDNHEEYA
jgi:hypothetical protein